MGAGEVRAAGGVVWRDGAHGLEVVLVHRGTHEDWSLPKGKREPGETDEECALREVEEETGLRCELGPELPSTRYVDRFGRPKLVRYWAMHPVGGALRPEHEDDEVEWLPVREAATRLTYDKDWQVLAAFVSSRRDAT